MDGLLRVMARAGSILMVTGPGGAPAPDITLQPGWGVELQWDHTVLVSPSPSIDVDQVEIAWMVPEGIYEVVVLEAPTNPAQPTRTRLAPSTFQVAPHPVLVELDQLRALRDRIDQHIRALEAQVAEGLK